MGTKSNATRATKTTKTTKVTALKATSPKAAAPKTAPKTAPAKKTGKPPAGSTSGKSITKATKATKASKPTKSDLLEEAADLLGRIEEAETACQRARLELDDAREGVKCAKQNYGACVDELRKLARARREKHPLLDFAAKQGKAAAEKAQATKDEKTEKAKAGPSDSSTATTSTTAAAAPNDTWKKFSIYAAGFAANHCEAMEAADISTLGELQAAMNRHGQWWAKDLKLGRFKEAIENTFNAYLIQFAAPEDQVLMGGGGGNVQSLAEIQPLAEVAEVKAAEAEADGADSTGQNVIGQTQQATP